MDGSRDQVLADFQSCTGMEDIDECFTALEAAEWNLLDAINAVMPQETQTLPSEHHELPLLMNVIVKYNDNTATLQVPPTETVSSIKNQLLVEFGVQVCHQKLDGWPGPPPANDEARLCDLSLGPTLHLSLTATTASNLITGDSFAEKLNHTYQLVIRDEDADREYVLRVPGSKTLAEIRQDFRGLSNIPAWQQEWQGWPEGAAEEGVTLAALTLDRPVHRLSVRRIPPAPAIPLAPPTMNDISSDESEEADEFEDATEGYVGGEDGMFSLPPRLRGTSTRPQPLVPPDFTDEKEAVMHFIEQFEKRYGPCHPDFFQGTFLEALQNSCLKPAKERRPLAVYLHHDGSVQANVFCSQLLCAETVVSYLTTNFVTFGWDLTSDLGMSRFLSTATQHLGSTAAATIRTMEVEQLPVLLVVTRLRSSLEVAAIVPGLVALDELMTRLIHATDMFGAEVATEMREEEERLARDRVKREQDAAYEESLKADRAKEEARQKKEEQEQKALEKLRMEDAVKEAIRQSLEMQVGPEPPADDSRKLSQVRIRLPNGQTITRRFLAADPLKMLLTFLASLGYPPEEYKVLSSWPRRDLTGLDDSRSLEDLSIYPQDTVTLEER